MTAGRRVLDSRPELAETGVRSPILAQLSRESKRVTIQGRCLYVVEGDLLLDEVQLAEYALSKESGEPDEATVATISAGHEPAKLLGISIDGKKVRWQPGKILRYYVAKETFPTTEMYQTVRDRIRQASEDWMATCGIRFEHRPALDQNPADRPTALFEVSYLDEQFIAVAFFPNDPVDRRFVLIGPSYFHPKLRFDKTGILRHELGHVLGFRHEHIRSGAPAACPGEPLYDTSELTRYDPWSVMHYFCGGVGSDKLEITELDRAGARRLYGEPYSSFRNID